MTDLDRDLKGLLLLLDTGKHDHVHIDRKFAVKAAAAVRALRDRPCPHIETGDGGTSHCALALHDSIRETGREVYDGTVWDLAPWASDAANGDVPEVNPYERVRLRAVSDRPGGTDNPTSDEPSTCPHTNGAGFYCDLPVGHDGEHVGYWWDVTYNGGQTREEGRSAARAWREVNGPAPTGGDDV